eukprot:NODE_12402_length_512_cov_99.897172_g12113_i0.p1 GENE.NODE_12402_length_512_cov_99.897172_g12113_i0~~NODE_12402_length_512_cov_99.897172_g12113_i0.p1  ORF type:complete len:131 (-),score=19.61 NODE_12402_length_512_cov_99.897172_g12113_i0:61-453(-)
MNARFLLAARAAHRSAACSLFQQTRYVSIPKGKQPGAGEFDDRVVNAVVPGKKFMLNVVSDVEVINDRAASAIFTGLFAVGCLVYGPIQPVWSVFTLALAFIFSTWMHIHTSRPFGWLLLFAYLLYCYFC